MPAKQAFISHVSTETELAQAFKDMLRRDFLGMLDVFVSSDRQTIEAGSRWLDEVDQALSEADLQLVLCSRSSVGRPWVNFEAGAAWLRRIPVIPVCHSGLTLTDLPVPLSMLQGVDCSAAGLQKLYDTVADVLEVTTPLIDFEAAAKQLALLQEELLARSAAIGTVEDPRILCAASEQYGVHPEVRFDLDVDVLRSVFGEEHVTVEAAVTRRRLTDLLTSGRFDIVHLVAPVEQRTGALLFSPVSFGEYEPEPGPIDRLTPRGFASLLSESETRLVVLASCRALLLAVEVAHVANMAAADDEISGETASEWADCFYRLLRQGKSVFKAMDLTRAQTDVPIRGVRHQDVAFTFTSE